MISFTLITSLMALSPNTVTLGLRFQYIDMGVGAGVTQISVQQG